MTWRDNLRPASFRGVPFKVKDRSEKGGRAIDNHEFPKRNSNFAEDMGRSARHIQVEAYLIGPDYMSQRDALIDACEKVGVATYQDYWGRSLEVVCESYDLKETQEEGRMARVSIKFIEAGSNATMLGLAATVAQLATAAAGLNLAALTSFASTAIVGQSASGIAALTGAPLNSLPANVIGRAAGSSLPDITAGQMLGKVLN
jgi:prophage DNA circulation protein